MVPVERDMLRWLSIQMKRLAGRQRVSRPIAGRKGAPMNTQTQKNILRTMEIATALVVMGGGLNILVVETLGSFDAAFVILALYVGSWAFVVGNVGLIFSSIWYFVRRKAIWSESTSRQQAAHDHAHIGLPPLAHR
jgi:hypothetical protein